jgi:DNA repair protein RadB
LALNISPSSVTRDLQSTARVLPTGCGGLDKLLEGGLHPASVTLVYGEAETGKTSLAIQCAVNATRLGYKVIFIDSDGSLSTRRLAQIAGHDLNEVAPKITVVQPTTFQEQELAIDRLDQYLTPQVGLVVVDTVTSLYRAEFERSKEKMFKMNRELGRQLANLAQIAKTRKIAVLITSQVRNAFLEGFVSIEPVATRVLRFWSDCVLGLKPADHRNTIKVVLEKHAQRTGPVNCYFSIEENGICDCR